MRIKSIPFFVAPGFSGWSGYATGLIISTMLVNLATGAIRSHYCSETPVNLAFPLKHGTYRVFEGGNGMASSFMNYNCGAAVHKGSRINIP